MLLSLLAALLAADVPAAAPAAAPPPAASGQAIFDAAVKALDENRWDDAAKGLEELERRPSVQRSPQVHGAVLLRLGTALIGLDRVDEAEQAIRKGLRIVPPDQTPAARWDRYSAEYSLGAIERDRFNYIGAAEHFRASAALADDPMYRARSLLSLARVEMFESAGEAISHADEAIRIVEARHDTSKEGKRQRADADTVKARILLNQGRAAEAYALLKQAVGDQGGLDLTVNYNEIITRSDLALAALMTGNRDDARRYLAYTGAGRLGKSPFDLAVAMAPPPCGGPANLRPDDVAVVEFVIQPDGTVRNATPVYASVQGGAAVEFARAVADWSWRPEDAAKIPDLFRAATRVELRCSNSVPRPPIDLLLRADLHDWLSKRAVPGLAEPASPAADVAPMRAELARRRSEGGGAALIPPLLRLAGNPVVSPDEQQAALVEARDLAIGGGAPPSAIASIEIRLAQMRRPSQRTSADRYRAQLRALLARPDLAGDARAANILRLMIAEPTSRSQPPSDAAALLDQIIADPRLAEKDPLRTGALIRLAALQAQAGDLTSAADSFRQTGLGAQQCALLDAKPTLLRDNVRAQDFPMEAARWGFEGWVRTEYDIDAQGKTAAQRAIVAYPPFVFRDAAVGIARKLTYSTSFRPDGSAGCGSQQENIRFGIPSRR